ncbi:MAG: GTP 3',8-cyclase MoaA [Candidatus Dormibacteraeota bacterium]|uniref:GTP 3',8-cyclase n=1 Tax=Candidatus Amunia macphersoniae TaxID=3127014 RepID=A0A934KMN4_9BACT|nr:GTP 3',8-cyclase MoaA [Candidatus Dormibacteraeota bacterium]
MSGQVEVPREVEDGPATTRLDRLGRPLRDVRISVTDRCNFRCTYCMPRASFGPGHAFLPRSATMTAGEIVRLGSVLLRLGVGKIRLTGGEPLLRGDLDEIVAGLSAAGVSDLALTTNGSLLSRWAMRLRSAGLHRLTVSLDTLDPGVHARLSDSGVPLATVLGGIDAALAAGFAPVKLNAVIRRGVNQASILPLADYARRGGHTLRLIEYMDVGESNAWNQAEVVPAAEMLATVAARYPLEPAPRRDPADVAQRYRFQDGGGEIGIIASVTQPFCGACTRLRVSADGRLHTCLFSGTGTDLLSALRSGDDDDLEQLLTRVWGVRADRYSEERGQPHGELRRIEMSYIGG